MIIEIVGKPRAGKTALNTLFAVLEERYNGLSMTRACNRIINKINIGRIEKLALYEKAPIYSNYEMGIKVGYNREFKPYYLNPYWLGIPTKKTADKIQYIIPCSCLHITEGRKYWDGRESSTMPDNVSQWFETHGHNYLTIIIDAQRGKALDLNIRENVNRFIEVLRMYNEEDAFGRVLSSTWYCREFYSLQDYEAYIAGKAGYYSKQTTYHYEGNIFEFFESRNRQKDFIPPEGKKYSALEYITGDELKKLPKTMLELYNPRRPEWYRSKAV